MRPSTMYNLNLAGASGSNLLSVAQGENSCTTPRTPEILNSLIAMSNPFDSYHRGGGLSGTHGPRLASSPPISGSDTNSTCSSGSPSCVSPPSVQLTCSKLIKEGLRHTLQTKRRNNSVSSDAQLSSIEDGSRTCKTEELTPEDEERRRRRRERNKIAATKCRMKKRERTVNLVQESEILETQNHDLKSQIQELEVQRKRLVEMLSGHKPTCKQAGAMTASASNFAASEQQTSSYHRHLESTGSSCSRSSSTVETMVYQRVNICNHPATTTLDSRLSYRRLEVSATDYARPPESLTPRESSPYDENTTVQSSYDSKTVHSPYNTAVQSPYDAKTVQSPYNTGVQSPCTTVQSSYDAKTVQSPYNTGVQSPCTTYDTKTVQSTYDTETVQSPYNTTVQSPYDTKTVQSPYTTTVQSSYEPNYQSSYHDDGVESMKDDDVWRSGSASSLNTQFGRISTTDSGYSCQQSLTSGMNSPMPFLQSDDGGSAYSRSASAIFSRPTSLDVSTSDYESNAEIVDSPTLPPPHTYRHYDSADSAYCASYVPPPSSNRGGCIS